MSDTATPIGTLERKSADGKTFYEIVDMAAYVKNAPDNNLTPDQMIDAFLEGVAIGRGEQKYKKYLEYSQYYMLVNSGIDLIECLKAGDVNRISDALFGIHEQT